MWGTQFKTDIFIKRETFSSIYELNDKIEEIESDINDYEKELIALGASTPKDIVPSDNSTYDYPIDIVIRRTSEIFEQMRELYTLLTNLYHLKDFLEENKDIDINEINSI